jgi:transposase-like protein
MKLNAKQKALINLYRQAEARSEWGTVGRIFSQEDKRAIVNLMEESKMGPCDLAKALGYHSSSKDYYLHQGRVRWFMQQAERERKQAGQAPKHKRVTIGSQEDKLQDAIRQRETRLIALAAEVEAVKTELTQLKGVIPLLSK